MTRIDLERLNSCLTSVKHERIFLASSNPPQTLNTALDSIHPTTDWRFQIEWGAVFVNGERTSTPMLDHPIPIPCKLEYYEAKYDQHRAAEIFPGFSKDLIVYEDEDLLVAFKPHHLATLPPKERLGYTLKSYLDDYCSSKVHIPSRLDSAACGLVPASKTTRMHDRLNRLYQHRRVSKSYLIESSSPVAWQSISVTKNIAKSKEHPILRCLSDTEGVSASTEFQLIETRASSALIRAKPLTGRTHQLRVHITAVSSPLVGDNFYGGFEAPELHLMSERLDFIHPLSQQPISIVVSDRHLPAWCQTETAATVEL